MSASISCSSKSDASPVVCGGAHIETQTFTWIIENFDAVRKSDELIEAQKFEFDAGDSVGLPTRWSFYLSHFREIEEPAKRWIGTFFTLLKKPTGAKEVNISFAIKCKWENLYSNSPMNDFFHLLYEPFKNMAEESVRGWGFYRIFDRDANVGQLPLFDGSLILEIEFKLLAAKPARLDLSSKLKAFESNSFQQLSRDLCKILTFPTVNADPGTKIISRDNVEFPVNRGVLSARSTVFERMFQGKSREAETGQVQIYDLSARTIKVLLQYICTGTLDQDWKSAAVIEEFTRAAHKYKLELLVDFLDDALGNVCTKDNAEQLAILAKKLGMNKAERELFTRLAKNSASLEDLKFAMEESMKGQRTKGSVRKWLCCC